MIKIDIDALAASSPKVREAINIGRSNGLSNEEIVKRLVTIGANACDRSMLEVALGSKTPPCHLEYLNRYRDQPCDRSDI